MKAEGGGFFFSDENVLQGTVVMVTHSVNMLGVTEPYALSGETVCT